MHRANLALARWMRLGSLAVTVAACGTPSDSTDAATVTDGAGVRLIHYPRAVVEAAPTLEPTEVLRIGTVDGPLETQFFGLMGAIERNGEIYLLDRGHAQVRVFGRDGSFLRAFGREGDGPGEFRTPTWIEFLGDTLVVVGRRLNMLDTEGMPLATAPARIAAGSAFTMRVHPTSVGWIAAWMSSPAEGAARGQPFRETVSLHFVERDTGERRTEIFSYERPEQRISLGEFPFYVTPYFQPFPAHEVGPDGLVYHTPGGQYRIDVIDPEARKLIRRVTANPAPAPITDELVDRAASADRKRARDAREGSEGALFLPVIDERLALGVSENLPVLGRFHVSSSGWLLVNRLDLDPDPLADGDPTTWDLFDPEGGLAGRLRLDAGTRILRLTDNGFLAAVRDELDVQSFVEYSFTDR